MRRGAKRVRAMWEERADQTDMEVCPDTAGEYCDFDAVETLSWYATVAESGQSKSARCSGGVTSTESHPCRQSSA